MRWLHLLIVLTAFLARAAAVEHTVFDGLLTFTPPKGEEEEMKPGGKRLLTYRDHDRPFRLMYTVNESPSQGVEPPSAVLASRLRGWDNSHQDGVTDTIVGAATVGPSGSLLIISEHTDRNDFHEAQRRWVADGVIQGNLLHIEAVMAEEGRNLLAKDVEQVDAEVQAFLASFQLKSTADHVFGMKPVQEALAAKPGDAAKPPAAAKPGDAAAGGKKAGDAKGAKTAAGQRQLFDGLVSFVPPKGDETDRISQGLHCYIYHDGGRPYDLRWNVNESNTKAEPPSAVLARQLRVIDIQRQTGMDKTVAGAAAVGPSGCLVITSWPGGDGNVHWAHRGWVADGMVDDHAFHLEIYMDQQVQTLQAKDVAQVDTEVEALLASFKAKDGTQPFGTRPVQEALAAKLPPLGPLGQPKK